jgi:hypothetical protein
MEKEVVSLEYYKAVLRIYARLANESSCDYTRDRIKKTMQRFMETHTFVPEEHHE